ncbi:hypothetical protein KBC40_01300 [Patescibacteria group bacterium]|nr:hypothetical protein [Patescibacteria group bacterium]
MKANNRAELRSLLASILREMPDERGFKIFDAARQHFLKKHMTSVEAVTYIISNLSVEVRRDKVEIHALLDGDDNEKICQDFLNSELRG